MRIFVSGASGFLGAWVVRQARERAHEVSIGLREGSDRSRLDRLLRAQGAIGPLPRPIQLDLGDVDRTELSGDDCDAIVHCAAYGVDYRQQDELQAVRVNVEGTLRLLRLARERGIPRFIHIGTSYEYGDGARPLGEDAPLHPSGVYGASKAAASLLLQQVWSGPNMPEVVVVRPFGMFGPGEGPHKLVPQVVRACLHGEPLALSAGHEERDYLYVGDVARCIVALCELEPSRLPVRQVLNLCSGEPVTIRQLVEQIARPLGGLELMRFGARASRPDAAPRIVGDPSRWRAFCRAAERPELAELTAMAQVVDALRDWEASCVT